MAEKIKEKKVKQPKTTLEKYRMWDRWHKTVWGSKFAMPLVPASIVLGLNWNEWVGNNTSKGWSIGVGFGMLIVACITSILAIMKRDEIIKKNISAVFIVAIVFLIVGFGFKLLASIANEFGDMFIYISFGVVAAAGVDQADKSLLMPKVEYYKGLVEENGLDKKSARRLEEEEQAKREGEQARKGKIDIL